MNKKSSFILIQVCISSNQHVNFMEIDDNYVIFINDFYVIVVIYISKALIYVIRSNYCSKIQNINY